MNALRAQLGLGRADGPAMPFLRSTLDPFAAFRHLEALRRAEPVDTSRWEIAQQRANDVLERFATSDEASALEDVSRWGPTFLRTAYIHHSVTIDELTPDVFREVAARFVIPNEMTSVVHWVAVIHNELLALFRFLDREGFAHARANVDVLEQEILPAHTALLDEASLTTPRTEH